MHHYAVIQCLFCTAVIALCVQMEDKGRKVESLLSFDCDPKAQSALVLYDPSLSQALPMYRATVRYEICNRTIEIEQRWAELGVSAVVWDAAPFLASYLEKNPATVQGKRVIELGAGTGLVGMAANLLGARDVIITDMRTRSAEHNLHLNNKHLSGSPIEVLHLEWGKDVTEFNPPYDLILAADVMYSEEGFAPLLRTLEQLSDRSTMILLSCARRYDRLEKFLSQAEKIFQSTVVLNSGNLSIYQFVKLM